MKKRQLGILLLLMLFIHSTSQLIFAERSNTLFYKSDSESQQLDLFFAGDLMLHGAQYKSSFDSKTGLYNFKDWFHHFVLKIASADYALLNFETTITENSSAYSGFPLFRSPDQIVYDLKSVGFDGVVTANNHSLDGGLKGLLTTIKHLEQAKLGYTGTAPLNAQTKPLLIEKNGIKIALINATYGTNGLPIPKDHPNAINLLSTQVIEVQMRQALALKPDAVIAYVHWGVEYQRQPNSYQKEWAQRIAELGATAIIGAHPHSIQPEAWLTTADGRSVYVNYSLGNFISNQRWRYSDTGLAITLTLKRAKTSGPLELTVKHHPIWVDKELSSGAIDYTIIPLLNAPTLKRLGSKDLRLMKEALSDFYELYPHVKKTNP